MKRTKMKKHTLLKGEGVNCHTLYGEFLTETEEKDFIKVLVKEDSLLKHETPSGQFAEHNTLQIDKGEWVMGKQVEFSPFDRKINRVWD